MSTIVHLPEWLPRVPAEPPPDIRQENLTLLRRLIWTYFWLLIFEGALRKWVAPGLANPLLIIRDPVVIFIYGVALSRNLFPWGAFISSTIALAVLSAAASQVAGEGNFLITVYGLRTNFLHLPLIFLIPKVFAARDVESLGKWLFYLAFPMALLVALQFRASPDSFLNVGAGGGVGGQMEVGFGKIRPPGTFSFTTGLLAFVTLTSAFVLSTLMQTGARHAKLALAALPAVAVMIAVSGSRGTLVSVSVIFAGVIFVCLKEPSFFGKTIKGFLVIGVAYLGLSFWSEFRNGLTVHETRLVTGGGLEHGLIFRVIGDLVAPLGAAADTPFLGRGLGMGTNAASGLLTGERKFLLAEGEWERVIRESGPALGFAYIGLRIAIVAFLGHAALAALKRKNPLPPLVFCAAFPQILNGQFGVPTTLGFAVFMAGLTLAAAKDENLPVPESDTTLPPEQPPLRKVRGRSEYAELLHRSNTLLCVGLLTFLFLACDLGVG